MKRFLNVILVFAMLITVMTVDTCVMAETTGRKFSVGNNEYILTDTIKEIDGKRYFGIINTTEVNVSGSGTKARLMLEGMENDVENGVMTLNPKLYYEYANWGDTWWFYKSPEEYKETAFPSAYFDGYLGVDSWDMLIADDITIKTEATDVTLPTVEELAAVVKNGDSLTTTASTKNALSRSVMTYNDQYFIVRYNLNSKDTNNISIEYIDASTQSQGWNTRSGYGIKEGGAYFLMAYVSEDFFKEVKLDVGKMAQGTKTVITSEFTKDDLKNIYSKDELRTLGFADDFVITADLGEMSFPLAESTEIGGEVIVENNTDASVDIPVIIIAEYNENGVLVGADAVISNGKIEPKIPSEPIDISTIAPVGTTSISIYAAGNGDSRYPLAESIIYGERPLGVLSEASEETIDVAFKVDEMVAEISGTLPDNKDQSILCVIFKPGKSFSDLTDENAADVLAAIEQITTDSVTGEYSCAIPVGDLEYKNYTVAVISADNENTDSFFYKDSDYEAVALSDFKKLNSGELSLDDMYEKYSEAWGSDFDTELYEKLDSDYKTVVAAALRNEYVSSADAVADLNRQMAIQVLNMAKTADDVEEFFGLYNKLIGLKTEGWIDSLDSDQTPFVYDCISKEDFADFDELEEVYFKAIILSKINTVENYKDIKTILNQKKELVESYGIDMDKFSELRSTGFAKSLAKKFESWDDFGEYYEEKAEKYEDELDDKKSSSGGGGGSGFKTSYVTVQTPTTVPDTTVPDTKPVVGNTQNTGVNFADLEDTHWASKYIYSLAEKGIVNGKDSEHFCPDDSITREEFVKILVLALGFEPLQAETGFDDVRPGSWYTPYINSAYANKIVMGKADNTFGVGELITREDAATMLHRALKCVDEAKLAKLFADDGEISDYARGSVYCLTDSGVISGVGNDNFAPKRNTTRAEAAIIIYLGIFDK